MMTEKLVEVLFVRPDGLAERRTVARHEIRPTGETTVILGWGRLDGPAAVCIGPAAGEYLLPTVEVEHA